MDHYCNVIMPSALLRHATVVLWPPLCVPAVSADWLQRHSQSVGFLDILCTWHCFSVQIVPNWWFCAGLGP